MRSNQSNPNQIIVLLAIFLIIMMVSSDQSSAVFSYIDHPVDSDSNIDSNSNIGNDGLTSYLDAQAVGGNNQTIVETNTYSGTQIEDPIDNNNSDIDSSPNFGALTNFPQSQSLDTNMATFTEDLGNDNSVDLSNNEYFLVGGGSGSTTSFGSTSGTIEMWFKFDVSVFGRPWGQNGDFEIRNGGGAFQLDFGNNGLTGNKANWVVGQWYFLAATWNETSDDLFLYWGDASNIPNIDGTNTAWTDTVSTLPNSDNRIFNGLGGDEPVDGHLDEFRYWNIERTLTEIRGDYDAILNGTETGLQHYYQFENDLTDLVGSSDLTPAGIGTYVFSTDTSAGLTDGYHMDQEVQFTNLIDFMEIEKVSIYTGSTSAESIIISYWNGTGWTQLFSDLTSNDWNNASVSLEGSTFTLQMKGLYSVSDGVQDTWNIDVILFVYEGEGTLEDYIDQESNIDVSKDKGIEDQFSDLQAADSNYATLLETLTTNTTLINKESFETNMPWTVSGTWARESDQAIDGSWSADYDGDDGSGLLTTDVYDTSNAIAIYIDFYWYDSGLNNDDLIFRLFDGTVWDDIVDLNIQDSGNGWHHYTSKITDSQYFKSNFRIRWAAITIATGKIAAIDNVLVDYEETTSTEFELDQEIQFINVINPALPVIELSIKTGILADEDIKVEYWNGGQWVEIAKNLIANSWNNLTVVEYVSSSTFTVRFIDGNKNSDTTKQDDWEIDAVILSHISRNNHYELDWEHQSTGIDTTQEFYLLTIYANSSDSTENFQVQLWNQSSSSWQSPFSLEINTTQQWYNYTISSDFISSTITWRYTGVLDGSENLFDTNQNTLYINYAGIASYEEVPIIQSNPADLEYSEGSTGNTLQWTVIDSNATTYTIYLDDVPGTATPWASGVPILYDVDGLAQGSHNVTIVVSDVSSNVVIDYVLVTVTDVVPPVISSPIDFSYEAGISGNNITWIATDFNADTYEIWNATHVIKTLTSWTSGVPIVYDVDGFLKGLYNFTIVTYDSASNFSNDTVFVTVVDTTKPQVLGPLDITFEIGEVGKYINWSISDLDPGTYTIYQNGSQVSTGNWLNGINTTYNLDSLQAGNYEFLISAFDDSGNYFNHTVNVIVTDFVDPSLNNPTDISFAEGSTGNEVIWIATDFDADVYIIYENGTQVKTASWTSGVDINYNLDSLLKGKYNYTIVVYDRTGNSAEHTIIITVSDETLPTVTSPIDFQYFEGETGSNINITWHTVDNYPVQLTIQKDGTTLYSFGWINDTDTVVIVDKLSAGLYNYTIIITDESGLFVVDTVWVTVVDNIAPIIDHPADITYTITFVDNTIEWIGTDLHSYNYTIYNDTLDVMQSGTWISSDPIILNVDGLSAGVYNYTIFISDLEGNQVNDTVTITVTEGSVFTNIPSDVFYIDGAIGSYLNWTVSDTNEDWYILYRNNVSISNGPWVSGTPLSFNVEGLAIGVYNFTLYINDTDGNNVVDLAWVTVSDLPVWISSPSDLIYIEETIGNNVNWSASDMFPDTYEIYNDTHLVDWGSWSSSVNITLVLDGLPKGVYNYTIYIYDTVNNTISDNFTVTVLDNTPPTISSPSSDLEYNEGDSPKSLNWTATDNYANIYEIWNSTNLLTNGSWISGENVNFDVSGLIKSITPYNFTIIFIDESGNRISHTAWVTVVDNTLPIISSPSSDLEYNEGDFPKSLNWTATDDYAVSYEIWNNTDIITSGAWTSGQTINHPVDGLAKGVYNFTIIFTDESSNNATHTAWVTVVDGTDPTFVNTPQNLIYSEGSSGNSLNWKGDDNYSGNYEIYNDTGLFASGTWTSGVNVTINFDGFPKGLYNYTITFYDQSSNSVVDILSVTVVDTTSPAISFLPDIEYAEGSTSNILSWNVTDNYPDRYEIWNSTDKLIFGIWSSLVNVTHNIDGYLLGSYNFTLIAFDISGNSIIDTVFLTVIDDKLPLFVSREGPIGDQYAEDQIGNTLTWTATDAYNTTYEIWNTTDMITSGFWNSGEAVIYNIDGLVKGTYNFTIVFIDTSGNKLVNSFSITVVDETKPLINSPSDISYLEGDPNRNITWIVSDNYEDYYEIYNGSNPIPIDSGIWTSGTIIIFVNGSILGDYFYTLYINDTSGNIINDQVIVRVVELTPPSFSFTPIDVQYNETEVIGKTLNWTAFDTYNESYIIHRNGFEIQNGFWNNGENITLNLDGLMKGVYNFTIFVMDSSDNIINSTVQVTIVDERSPELATPPGDFSYESGVTGNKITWTFTDNYDDTFIIYHNGTIVDSGFWKSSSGIGYNVDLDRRFGSDPLPVGFHNFTIVVIDKSGNQYFDIVIVEVTDTTSPEFSLVPVSTYNYIEISTGNQLNFTVFDINPSHYDIFENGTIVRTTAWQSGVEIVFPNLENTKGLWNYTIVVYDETGNFVIHTTWVTITDITSPVFFVTPTEMVFTIIEGEQVSELQWSMVDRNGDSYSMYKNNAIIESGNWVDFELKSFDINGLSPGVYNYTLYINDTSSNFLVSTVIITVDDQKLPVFIMQPTISNYTEGTIGHDLIWTVAEIHPAYYNISINWILIVNGSFLNNEDLIRNIDNLEAGSYNFTIYFVDESGNEIFQTFILDVFDTTNPEIISAPLDDTIHEGTIDNYLVWEVTDIHPDSWLLFLDGGQILSGTWTSTDPIEINIDGKSPGFYEFRIEIQDESGNVIVSTVTIRVKDPFITDTIRPNIELQQTVYEGDQEDFTGTWFTTFEEGHEGVDGGIVRVELFQNLKRISTSQEVTFSDGNYTIVFDYSGLLPENYTWKISFLKDEYQEWHDIIIEFEVLPHKYSLQIIIEDSIQQGREFRIAVSVRYEDNSTNSPVLSLSEYSPISENLAIAPKDVSVLFTIVLRYEDGTNTIIITGITDDNGIALVVLTELDTTGLIEIVSLNAQIADSATHVSADLNFNPDKLPEVNPSEPTSMEVLIQFIQDNIILFPVILGVIISLAVVAVQFNNRRVEKIRQINNAVKSAHVELQAIKSIESIIIQTSSKLTIYEEQVATTNVNSTLIGGMVTAFSSFLDEVGKSELFGFEMMEREGLSLTLHQGKISNMIIISTEKLPIVVLSQIKEAQEDIERSFKNNFTNTARGVTRLTSIEIHPKFHNANFKLDLVDDLIFNDKNIKRMLRQRSLSRALKHNIRILYDFPESEYFEGDSFKLNDIIEFFKSKGITERVSSRTIMLAYQFDVIETSQSEHHEIE